MVCFALLHLICCLSFLNVNNCFTCTVFVDVDVDVMSDSLQRQYSGIVGSKLLLSPAIVVVILLFLSNEGLYGMYISMLV